jgi:GNAT superfamily N-acetyltransferase
MTVDKSITINDIKHVFEGEIPEYHPVSYFKSRINDGMGFIAKDSNNEPIGFLIYNIWWGNCPSIELIKVKEKHQRHGAGTELLEAAKKEIKSLGFSKLISSTEVINPLGLGFHDKIGFKKLNSLNLPHGEEQFYSINLD